MKTQEILTVEFRYYKAPANEDDSTCKTKTIAVGVYDTPEEAVIAGNEVLKMLSRHFQVREDDRFKIRGLFGLPNRLVSNHCYPTNGICYFAKITRLDFVDLADTVNEVFVSTREYEQYEINRGGDDAI